MRKEKGFFYDKKKGHLRYRFTVDGKTYSVYGQTKTECREKESDLRDSLKNHMHLDNQKITLELYYEAWKEEQEKDVKPSTMYAYEKTWKNIKKSLGSMKLVDIQKLEVQRFQKSLSISKSPETTNRALRLLKQILTSAVNDRIISFNPCNGVKFLKSEKAKAVDTNHRALTEEETKLFLENAEKCHYYLSFRFLLATGCRAGEATALTWFDVDFSKGEIAIRKTVSRVSHNDFVISNTPKTESSNRIIPMTDEVKALLKEQRERNQMLFGSSCPFVFPNNQGNLANHNGIDNSIRGIIRNINHPKEKTEDGKKHTTEISLKRIEPFSAHAFRSTFATRCIEQGMQPNTLKTLLGHSALDMTMDVYAHVMPNTKLEELKKIRFVV